MSGDCADLTDGGCGAVDRLATGAHGGKWRNLVNTTRAESPYSRLVVAARSGFRPSSRSRMRIAVGTLLSLIGVGIVLLVFSTADRAGRRSAGGSRSAGRFPNRRRRRAIDRTLGRSIAGGREDR